MAKLFFLLFGGLILGSASVAVLSRNLVYSAISLLITFVSIAGIYVLLNAEFIAAVQIIVYAGAILVLYLFVLMLFNPKTEERAFHTQWRVGLVVVLVLLGEVTLALFSSAFPGRHGEFDVRTMRQIGNTQAIGRVLFTDYLFPFEIASLILLVSMLGAIVLSKRDISGPPLGSR